MTAGNGTESIFRDSLEGAPAQQGYVLRVTEGADEGKEVPFKSGIVTVGTKTDCTLRLSDSTVSGHHLSIQVVPDGILVTDLGSKNGTFYLGTRLEKATLQPGAAVRLGRTRLLLASQHPPAGLGYSDRTSYGSLIGTAPSTRRLFAILEQLEPVDYTTLILGETGVGKEHVAKEIHAHSRRSKGPIEVCDCAALAPQLVESELFGHVRGAFTGALNQHQGVFERANGGTIFLDEIGELPLELQPRLLRVLETRKVRRVGGDTPIPADVRVVAATNRDLGQEVRDGAFRQDLFYRLNVVSLEVPPLRDRREDIPLLVRRFLEELGHPDLELSPDTLELFTTGYDWPGNVRELKHAVARIQALGALPEELASQTDNGTGEGVRLSYDEDATFQEAKKRIVTAFERDYLADKLVQCDNNISQAARASGMERNQFKRLLRKYGLI